MADGTKQSLTSSWITTQITLPPGFGAQQTTSYLLQLPINDTSVATVQVLLPFARGVVYSSLLSTSGTPQPTTLSDAQTVTFDNLLLSVDVKSSQLFWQMSPKPTSTPPPTPASTANALDSANPESTPASTSSLETIRQPSNSAPSSTGVAAQPKNAGSELSTGAIAGIALGCLLAGAVLAGIVLWFCWRRNKASSPQHVHGSTNAMAFEGKGYSTNTMSLRGTSIIGAGNRGGYPQPLEDKAISGDISKISNAIKNHVQSYYHTSQVSIGLVDYDDLQALGHNLPFSVGTLTTMMGNAATREIALRFIIAWVVVSKVQPSKDSSKTLLPSEVAQCYQAISTEDHGYQAQASLMAHWRVMTAELMQSSYVRNPFSSSDSRHTNVQATLAMLDRVLQPYADSRMNNGERKRNLEELLKRASLFAFTLFSQPSAWKFEWHEGQGATSGELCIFPALMQVADEAGQPVSPPRPFSEAVVRRVEA